MPLKDAKLPHEKLASDLLDAGLPEMSFAASALRYHDFRSPVPDPAMTLARELFEAATRAKIRGDATQHAQIAEIYSRHSSGLYDATPDESAAWAEGPEGQKAFSRLLDPDDDGKD
jgi:hypothetical protein